MIAAAALIVFTFFEFWWSVAAFATLLIGGTALVFAQRLLDVAVYRRAGRPAPARLLTPDRVALGLMMAASLANGVVIANELARR